MQRSVNNTCVYGWYTQYHSHAGRRRALVTPRPATLMHAMSEFDLSKEDAFTCVDLGNG